MANIYIYREYQKLRVADETLKSQSRAYIGTTLSVSGNNLTISAPKLADITFAYTDVKILGSVRDPILASANELQLILQLWINEGIKEKNNDSDYTEELNSADDEFPCFERWQYVKGTPKDLRFDCMSIAFAGGGPNPGPCIQFGINDGDIPIWNDTNQCYEPGTLSIPCIEDGTQQGNTLYWDVVDNCYKETESVRHQELGTALITSNVDKNVVLISEKNTTVSATTVNSSVSNSNNCEIDGFNISISNSENCAVLQTHQSSVTDSYYCFVDNTNNPGAGFNSVENSVFSDVTDVWNVHSIKDCAGATITGFTPGDPNEGTLRGMWLAGGVDINDLLFGRRIGITGVGHAQAIACSAVDPAAVNSSLFISNDKSLQVIINCSVEADNTAAGIFDGRLVTMIGCKNPIYNNPGEGVTLISIEDPNITDQQNWTVRYPTERSFGGKQYRIDNFSTDTLLDYSNHQVLVDTSTLPQTETLPDPPVDGQHYVVTDATGNASVNNITIDAGLRNILSPDSQATTYIIDIDFGSITFIYSLADDSWHLTSSIISSSSFSTTCLSVGTQQGNIAFWDNTDICWEETEAVRIATIGTLFSNSGADKAGVFISDKNSTFGVLSNTSANIANDTCTNNIKYGVNAGSSNCILSTLGSSEHNFNLFSQNCDVGSLFGSDGSWNGFLLSSSGNISGSNFTFGHSNQFSNANLCNRIDLGFGSQLNAQGCIDGELSGQNNTATNSRNFINIGGRFQLIAHNINGGQDNVVINSPYTSLYPPALIDFTDILSYIEDQKLLGNYTSNLSIGGGGNIVKNNAAFSNEFFNSYGCYVDNPYVYLGGESFGKNTFIGSQECYVDNQFGPAGNNCFVNSYQNAYATDNGPGNPSSLDNTFLYSGFAVGSSGNFFSYGGTITNSGGCVSIMTNGTMTNANFSLQGLANGSTIVNCTAGLQLNAPNCDILTGSHNFQLNTENVINSNSIYCGAYNNHNLANQGNPFIRILDSFDGCISNCSVDTNTGFVDLDTVLGASIDACLFSGTNTFPNYTAASWGILNATQKHAQKLFANTNPSVELGNNCWVAGTKGLVRTDLQDEKGHIGTLRQDGGNQYSTYVTTDDETLIVNETHKIIIAKTTLLGGGCTFNLYTTPINGELKEFYAYDTNIFSTIDGQGISIKNGAVTAGTFTGLGLTSTYVRMVYDAADNVWIILIKA